MDEVKSESRLSQAATLWQLIYGIGTTVIAVTGFLLLMRSDVNANQKDIQKHDKRFDAIDSKMDRFSEKSEENQREILDAINEVKLQMKDKLDRN
jgi:low affinity Fe/Cu permease